MFGAPPPAACTIDIVMEGFLIALFLLPLSAAADNLYALTATDIAGNRVSLEEYKGKVIMLCCTIKHLINKCLRSALQNYATVIFSTKIHAITA